MSQRSMRGRPLQSENTQRRVNGHARRQAVQQIPPAKSFFAEGWEKAEYPRVVATGIPFLDDLLGGGHASGQVYGLMGPNRSDNTTLAVMLCCEAARGVCAMHPSDGNPESYAVLVNYRPAPHREIEYRALSYAATVHDSTFEYIDGYLGIRFVSTSTNLRCYEKKLFHAEILARCKVPGELERITAVAKGLWKRLLVVDMNAGQPNGLGEGYIPEVAEAVDKALKGRSPKAACRLLVVNDARDVAERYMLATEKYNESPALIRRLGLLARSELAYRFHCPVWLMYELPDTPWPRSMATWRRFEGSRQSCNFEEYLDYSLIMVPHNKDDQYRLFASRQRRPGGPPQIVRVNADLNRLEAIDIAPKNKSRRSLEATAAHVY